MAIAGRRGQASLGIKEVSPAVVALEVEVGVISQRQASDRRVLVEPAHRPVSRHDAAIGHALAFERAKRVGDSAPCQGVRFLPRAKFQC